MKQRIKTNSEHRDSRVYIEPVDLGPVKEPGKVEEPVKKNIFQPNSKYFTIGVYFLLFFTLGLLIYKLIGNFNATARVFKRVLSLLSPFLIGVFIAFFLYPLVHGLFNLFVNNMHMKSRKLAKWLSIIITYAIALGLFALLLVVIIPQVYYSISEIVEQMPGWYDKFTTFLDDYQTKHENTIISYEFINSKIEESFPQIVSNLTGFLTNILPYILNASVAIVKSIINLLIAIIVSIYMIADHKNILYHFKRFNYALFPNKIADGSIIIFKNCSNIFINFIIGKSIDSLIIGIICFITMTLLRLPYALLISVIVGITNMIPYFGPIIGGIIGGIVIIIINPMKVIVYAIMVFILQQFDGLFLGPKILGDSTGLKPIWVIFAISIGGSLFGFVGMFLGVPVFAVISYLIDITVGHFLKKRKVTVEPYKSADDL